jgi:hypothetical protein
VESATTALHKAAELNLEDPFRAGSLLCFPEDCQVVMTGDLHGHHRNFEKLVKHCRLEGRPEQNVILHEMIHADPDLTGGVDHSFAVLLDAAKWKTYFPDQVHFLQSNHELAHLQKQSITKGGRIVNEEFERGVAEVLGADQIDSVLEAIDQFIGSFPIAGRTANRIFLSHSLPDAADMSHFDPDCVHQPADKLDLTENGSVYDLVWGRRHTPELLDELGAAYDADFFLIGHQPQDFGYQVELDRLIILASDNNHGVFLPVDCSQSYTIQQLAERIRPFAGVI